MICAPVAGFAGQAAAGSGQGQAPVPVETAGPVTISGMLQPSLDTLQGTLAGTRLEKWKGGSVRAEAEENIGSIRKDLQGALPKLIADADGATGSLSKALPVSRNLDALYDVLLRVVDGARIAGPGDQVDQLQQAMAGVEKARLALNDRLQAMAEADQKQIGDLRAAVKAQAATMCPVVTAPACPAPAPKKRVVRKKPAAPAANGTPQPKSN